MIRIEVLDYATRKGNFFGRKTPLLQAVTLHIPSQEIFAIIGPNGAGKSTLIKTILGFTKPSSGSISLSGSPAVGFLPENPYYYSYLTFKELLWFSAKSCGMNKEGFSKQLRIVAATVGMENHIGKKLHTFSKGMTQRAGIAAAIIHDPDLVILDEPMSGLDPLGRKMVFDLINNLKKRKKTILFCSHILNDVEKLCDKVAIMNQGKIQRLLTREELLLARKEIQIIVRADEPVCHTLKTAGYHFKSSGKYANVYLETSCLSDALQFFSEQGITTKTIRDSEATLEKIFYQTVETKEN